MSNFLYVIEPHAGVIFLVLQHGPNKLKTVSSTDFAIRALRAPKRSRCR
jgi:hypothetical protein